MNATIAVIREVITLIDVLTVEPGDPAKLLESLRQNADRVVSNKRRVVIYSQWHDLASVHAITRYDAHCAMIEAPQGHESFRPLHSAAAIAAFS
jgi:hypothetical protein